MSMNIAITQRELIINNFTYDCLSSDWYSFLSPHNVIPVPNSYLINFDNIDFLILSGGDNTANRKITEEYCINLALEKNIPILGICHGAFVLNEYYNGITNIISSHKNTYHKIFMEGEEFNVNSYHELNISKLSNDLNPIATINNEIEGFKHNKLNIWGLVWHPERMSNPVLPTDLREVLWKTF